MEHKQVVEIPARTVSRIEFVTCDFCNEKIQKRSCYDINEVTITHRTGSNYPEGGSGEEISIDICPECFTKKLIPWMQSQGVAPRTEEWDW